MMSRPLNSATTRRWTVLLGLFVLAGHELTGSEAVDDRRTSQTDVPRRGRHSPVEPVRHEATKQSQCREQQQRRTRQSVHATQLTHVNPLADEPWKQQVHTGTQLHQQVA